MTKENHGMMIDGPDLPEEKAEDLRIGFIRTAKRCERTGIDTPYHLLMIGGVQGGSRPLAQALDRRRARTLAANRLRQLVDWLESDEEPA